MPSNLRLLQLTTTRSAKRITMRFAPEEIGFSDYIGLNAALFEWAESYDSKVKGAIAKFWPFADHVS